MLSEFGSRFAEGEGKKFLTKNKLILLDWQGNFKKKKVTQVLYICAQVLNSAFALTIFSSLKIS